jgi:hypothetical protein
LEIFEKKKVRPYIFRLGVIFCFLSKKESLLTIAMKRAHEQVACPQQQQQQQTETGSAMEDVFLEVGVSRFGTLGVAAPWSRYHTTPVRSSVATDDDDGPIWWILTPSGRCGALLDTALRWCDAMHSGDWNESTRLEKNLTEGLAICYCSAHERGVVCSAEWFISIVMGVVRRFCGDGAFMRATLCEFTHLFLSTPPHNLAEVRRAMTRVPVIVSGVQMALFDASMPTEQGASKGDTSGNWRADIVNSGWVTNAETLIKLMCMEHAFAHSMMLHAAESTSSSHSDNRVEVHRMLSDSTPDRIYQRCAHARRSYIDHLVHEIAPSPLDSVDSSSPSSSSSSSSSSVASSGDAKRARIDNSPLANYATHALMSSDWSSLSALCQLRSVLQNIRRKEETGRFPARWMQYAIDNACVPTMNLLHSIGLVTPSDAKQAALALSPVDRHADMAWMLAVCHFHPHSAANDADALECLHTVRKLANSTDQPSAPHDVDASGEEEEEEEAKHISAFDEFMQHVLCDEHASEMEPIVDVITSFLFPSIILP